MLKCGHGWMGWGHSIDGHVRLLSNYNSCKARPLGDGGIWRWGDMVTAALKFLLFTSHDHRALPLGCRTTSPGASAPGRPSMPSTQFQARGRLASRSDIYGVAPMSLITPPVSWPPKLASVPQCGQQAILSVLILWSSTPTWTMNSSLRG